MPSEDEASLWDAISLAQPGTARRRDQDDHPAMHLDRQAAEAWLTMHPSANKRMKASDQQCQKEGTTPTKQATEQEHEHVASPASTRGKLVPLAKMAGHEPAIRETRGPNAWIPWLAEASAPRAARGSEKRLRAGRAAQRRGARGDAVDEVVRHLPPFSRPRLGGADVEPAVDRHRVDADDLRPQALGHPNPQGGFPGRRGAGEEPAIVAEFRPGRGCRACYS